MANLFKAAKEQGSTPAAKSNKEEILVKDSSFHTTLTRLAEVNQELDALSSESKILTEEVKERSIHEFAKAYESTGKFTGSFNIRATGAKGKPDASFMFIPTDRYTTIDEERFNCLTEQFGEEIAEETTTYTMDSELIEKYGEIISDLIEKCKKIEDGDKKKLIKAVTKFNVRKGTISNLTKFEGHKIENLLANIKPVYQMKNVKVAE
jgi:hypothetical protein